MDNSVAARGARQGDVFNELGHNGRLNAATPAIGNDRDRGGGTGREKRGEGGKARGQGEGNAKEGKPCREKWGGGGETRHGPRRRRALGGGSEKRRRTLTGGTEEGEAARGKRG